jgi:hypothetical protein
MTTVDQELQVVTKETEVTKFQELVAALTCYMAALDNIMQTEEGRQIGLEATKVIGHILGGVIKIADSIPALGTAIKIADKASSVEKMIATFAPSVLPDSPQYRQLVALFTAIKQPAPDVGRKAKFGVKLVSKVPMVGRAVDAAGDSVFTVLQIGTDLARLRAITLQLKQLYGADLEEPGEEVAAAVRAFLPDVDLHQTWQDARAGASIRGQAVGDVFQGAGAAIASRTQEVKSDIRDADIGGRLSQAKADAGDKAKQVAEDARGGFTRFAGRFQKGKTEDF